MRNKKMTESSRKKFLEPILNDVVKHEKVLKLACLWALTFANRRACTQLMLLQPFARDCIVEMLGGDRDELAKFELVVENIERLAQITAAGGGPSIRPSLLDTRRSSNH